MKSSWILSEIFKSTLRKPTWLTTTSTNLNSPHATTQGGNQVELQTTDLPMKAIQAMEELAKVLKQFCTTTSGKKHLHHISPPCRIAKQFSFLLVAIFPSSVILSFQLLLPYFWFLDLYCNYPMSALLLHWPPPSCSCKPHSNFPRSMKAITHFSHWPPQVALAYCNYPRLTIYFR